MAQNVLSGLVPRGSLGLKLLLLCLLVLLMGIPLLTVNGILTDRQSRANEVTTDISNRAGGGQVVGGPMLVVPYTRATQWTDDHGRVRRQVDRGNYVIFPETGSANANLDVQDRRRGIYRAAVYTSTTDFNAQFNAATALRGVDPSYQMDWSKARLLMFVSDSRAIRDRAELQFADNSTTTLEPVSDLRLTPQVGNAPPVENRGLQAFAAPANLTAAPENFSVKTRLVLGGAGRFALAAFAQNTTATIHGDRRDVSAEGSFQTADTFQLSTQGFNGTWRVPFVARGMEKAIDLSSFSLDGLATRDMAVSFVSADDIYQGVVRALRYGIMFIGIVFLATLVFEAVSGKKAHPAQYILVGLAQCVFYLLLLSMTELLGFTVAFILGAAATVLLLSYYAGASFKSGAIGVRAFFGLGVLYGAMYVLMTLEDFAMLAGSVVAFLVIAATMIATRRIDWYGRGAAAAE